MTAPACPACKGDFSVSEGCPVCRGTGRYLPGLEPDGEWCGKHYGAGDRVDTEIARGTVVGFGPPGDTLFYRPLFNPGVIYSARVLYHEPPLPRSGASKEPA